MTRTLKRPATGVKRKNRSSAFPVEFRMRIVKLYLEERYTAKLLVEQFGISTHSIQRWVKDFRLHGAGGLEPKRWVGRRARWRRRCGRGRWLVKNGLIRIQKAALQPAFQERSRHGSLSSSGSDSNRGLRSTWTLYSGTRRKVCSCID